MMPDGQYYKNEQPPLIIEHKKDHDILHWKSRSLLWTGT
jgi:hypothetical protein